MSDVAPTASPSSTPPRLPAPGRQAALRALLFIAALLPALMFFGLGAYMVHQSRQQYEQRAELLTQSLVLALDRSLSAQIEKIDMALASAVNHLEEQLQGGAIDHAKASAHILSQSSSHPELEAIRVTNAHGLGVLGRGLENLPALSFADREWFTAQRDNPDAGLFMGQPLVSKVNGAWIISFSRRYNTPQGQFAGGVSAAIPLSFMTRQLLALNVGTNGLLSLHNESLLLIAQHSPAGTLDAEEAGSNRVSSELRLRVSQGQRQGSFVAVTPGDGLERSFSFRRLAAVPMVVTVGLARDDYLADWVRESRMVVALCAALLLVYAVAGVLLWRMLQQNRRARQRIELLAKVFEHSGEAIVIADRDFRVVEVNAAYLKQNGGSASDVVGHRSTLLDSPRMGAQDRADIQVALNSRGRWCGETWCRARDGRDFPCWLSISVLRDDAGAISHHIATAIDVTEVKQAQDRVHQLAHNDTLTQLPNRVTLLARLEQSIVAARRDDAELAVLLIDMDRFKTINDTLGHSVGDSLLVEVGRRLRALVRESDIVARLGGDEFVLVLKGPKHKGARAARAVAHKVAAELGRPYRAHDHLLHSTPSVGIALFPADGSDAGTLMRNADAAMYHAKAMGRNNHQFFAPAMNDESRERLALEDGLRTAIAQGELFLHYQPQQELGTGRVVAVEALVRWQHPERGLVPPMKFIPVAEDTGQIVDIGAWVLDEALRQLALWRATGQGDLRVAVNLSAQQLRGDDFATRVSQALQRHHLPGSALELEITESVAMHDPARTAQLLGEMRRHGVALAIDDFGTGHSSLAYLKQLPLSCLKLDRSFVRDIESDPSDAAICQASIGLAHALGLKVVAEGVETAAQLAFLQRLGCDIVQGYFISRPLAAADLQAFLQPSAAQAVTAAAPAA